MDLEIKRFDVPDETRAFELGTFDVLTIGDSALGRARYEPGWRWSTHVGSGRAVRGGSRLQSAAPAAT
jgi:hypothetical protein